jgi:hypothetical protein
MDIPDAVTVLERDLRGTFGKRLQSFVMYGRRGRAGRVGDGDAHAEMHGGAPTHTLGVVETLTTADLQACATQIDVWHDRGLATPLLVAAHEFSRSLDVFPFEFGAILSDYVVVSGSNPFDGLRVAPEDLRRACEVEARGHLLHLREGYLETRGRGDAVAFLIVESAPAFAALISSVAQLDAAGDIGVPAAARHVERRLALTSRVPSEIVALIGVSEIPSAEGARLFGPYLDTVERLVKYVDSWR